MDRVWSSKGASKQRATARPANSVCRNVITVCYPLYLCVYQTWIKLLSEIDSAAFSVFLSIVSGTMDWIRVSPQMPILSGSRCRLMKAITLWNYLEGFQLIIRSRSGVYRNSWSCLLAELYFHTLKDDWFGPFTGSETRANNIQFYTGRISRCYAVDKPNSYAIGTDYRLYLCSLDTLLGTLC